MSREGSVGPEASSMAKETQLEEVSREFKSILLNVRIPSFRGEALKLNEWLKAIQKKKVVFGLTKREMILLAYETVAGAPSDFIEKNMEESPEITWAELREKLETEYVGELLALEAMRRLAELKQKEGETLVELGERIIGIVTVGFPPREHTIDTGAAGAVGGLLYRRPAG